MSFDGFGHYNPLLYAGEIEEHFGIQFDSLAACSSITKYMLPRTYDIYGSSRLGTMQASSNRKDGDNRYSRKLGGKGYEITDHLGNVHVVISDKKLWPQDTTIEGFKAEVLSRSDYYPFGMQITNRTFGDSLANYGFGGQLKESEISGKGGVLNYKHRMFNSKIARFFAVDPIAAEYPWLTPYQHSSLNPIWNYEIEGLEGKKFQSVKRRKKPKTNNKITGGGLIGLLGGLRGKFLKHNTLFRKRNPNLPITGSEGRKETGIDEETPNGLERITPAREEANGVPVEFEPNNREGKIVVEFDPGVDENGDPVEKTIEIGIMDQDGNKRTLEKATTDKPIKLEADFKLKKGETLFKTETSDNQSNGSTTTGAFNK